jgi:ribosomal small subunit protein bTHX
MGKGDPRSKRGKIFKGSFGKTRPKAVKKNNKKEKPAPAAT